MAFQHGHFQFPEKTVTNFLSTFDITKMYAVRVYTRDEKVLGWGSVFNLEPDLPYRTFRAHTHPRSSEMKGPFPFPSSSLHSPALTRFPALSFSPCLPGVFH